MWSCPPSPQDQDLWALRRGTMSQHAWNCSWSHHQCVNISGSKLFNMCVLGSCIIIYNYTCLHLTPPPEKLGLRAHTSKEGMVVQYSIVYRVRAIQMLSTGSSRQSMLILNHLCNQLQHSDPPPPPPHELMLSLHTSQQKIHLSFKSWNIYYIHVYTIMTVQDGDFIMTLFVSVTNNRGQCSCHTYLYLLVSAIAYIRSTHNHTL